MRRRSSAARSREIATCPATPGALGREPERGRGRGPERGPEPAPYRMADFAAESGPKTREASAEPLCAADLAAAADPTGSSGGPAEVRLDPKDAAEDRRPCSRTFR